MPVFCELDWLCFVIDDLLRRGDYQYILVLLINNYYFHSNIVPGGRADRSGWVEGGERERETRESQFASVLLSLLL